MKINVDNLTREETIQLFRECLTAMVEEDILVILREWLKEQGLEGEL